MKSVATTTYDTITYDYHNTVGLVVRAEWNLNRYYNTLVDNTPSEDTNGYDVEFFPIESITKSNRPYKSGICKAVVGQAVVTAASTDVPAARYYTVDADDEYKYWQSPTTAAAGTFALTDCKPQVLYVDESDTPIQVTANKISFTVENTFAMPVDYDVQVKYTTGGAWTTVASDIAVPSTGVVQLWYNGTAWTTTPDYDSLVDVHAVRLVINNMNKVAYFNLIELGFRIESDISSDVENWSDNFNMGEVDFVTPLGTISSNTGSLSLFNENSIWKNSNPDSPYYQLLDKGVKFTCWTKYGSDLVQEFELFSDTWDESDDETTTVNLVDDSKFFMETKPRAVLYQNITVQEAIWRLCDIVGFNKYNVDNAGDADTIIDIFWTNGEQTVWEIFSELARGTQTAIYFDSYGVLQIKPREAAWDNTQPTNYNFIKNTVPGVQPSNIVTLDSSTKYEANKVTVNYKPTGFSEKIDNITPFEVVWEPEGTVTLRSTPLQKAIDADDMVVNLGSAGRTWPFSGIMQIEGEWISYDAKWYNYYTAAGARTGTWVENLEQQQKLDTATGPFYKHMNSYSGNLRVKERGLWNTGATAHSLSLAGKGWATYRQKNYGASYANTSSFRINSAAGSSTYKSSLTIDAPKVNSDFYHYLVRGNPLDVGYRYLGTRLKIDRTSHTYKGGGIFFNASGVGTGYFIEVMATARMTGAMRKNRNEIVLYSMKADGSKKIIGGEEIRIKNKAKGNKKGSVTVKDIGAKFAVPQGVYINIDVTFAVNGSGDHVITVYGNGRFLFTSVVDNASTWKQDGTSGRIGLFARGNTSITYDYIYGIYNNAVNVPEIESFYDRIESSWVSDSWQKDWAYATREARRKVRNKWVKYQQKYNQRFFDEFGPMVHEVREFNVKFSSDTPVLEAKLYSSNKTQVAEADFVADVSGAKFTLGNMHRANAVVNGEDTLTASGNTINHKLLVYGRPVIQKDAKKIERTDEWGLRRRGPIEVEYESKWVQNETEATRFADWLTTHWTRTDTDLEVEVFGNPLIELTDLVHVAYDDIDDDFYVVGVSNSWSSGLTTNLQLRKA